MCVVVYFGSPRAGEFCVSVELAVCPTDMCYANALCKNPAAQIQNL